MAAGLFLSVSLKLSPEVLSYDEGRCIGGELETIVRLVLQNVSLVPGFCLKMVTRVLTFLFYKVFKCASDKVIGQ